MKIQLISGCIKIDCPTEHFEKRNTPVVSGMMCIMHAQESYLSHAKKTAINYLGSIGFMMPWKLQLWIPELC